MHYLYNSREVRKTLSALYKLFIINIERIKMVDLNLKKQ